METGAEAEEYLLLLLADSNLPTGAFVASSGLESYFKHGFAALSGSSADATLKFVQCSLESFSRSTLAFVTDAHEAVSISGTDFKTTMARLHDLDDLYHSMTLNTVIRRASQSQGVALLTLYSKGFAKEGTQEPRSLFLRELADEYKLSIRRGDAPGHLPICWGILTAALGLSLKRAQYLHLFLNARSLLSASVRLLAIGPYASQQLLLHDVRPLVDNVLKMTQHLRTRTADASLDDLEGLGPENTWPLGDLLAARHDMQQSRIFNS